MTQPLITQYMGILLPTIMISEDYVTLLSNAFTTIDDHNHDDVGKHLTEKSILWTNFSVDNNSLVDVTSIEFTPLTSAPTPFPSLFFMEDSSGIDLFYENNTGVIRITQNGVVAFQSIPNGFLGNFALVDASVVYDVTVNTYTFNIGSLLGNIRANTFNIVTLLTGQTFSALLNSPFPITSTGYFYNNASVLCTEGSPVADIKFETTQIGLPINVSTNPRLMTTVNQLNNVQTVANVYFRQTRYDITPSLIMPGINTFIDTTLVPGSCFIQVYIGTEVTTYENLLDGQVPPQEVYAQNTTPASYQYGAVMAIIPSFAGTIGTIRVTGIFHTGVTNPYSSPLFNAANKIFNISFLVGGGTTTYALASFQEFQGYDPLPVGSSGDWMLYEAYYQFELVDATTQIPVTNYTAVLRF